jgi:membrane protease YdiL (CAAX protease family)
MQAQQHSRAKVNWNQVAIFVIVTYGLAFILDLVLYLTAGYGQNVATGLLLQVQMLIPASVAIALQLFLFRKSRIYHLQERPRWFFYFFLAYALIYAALAFSVLFVPSTTYHTIVGVAVQALNVGGLVFLVVLRILSGKESFRRAGLSGGQVMHYVLFGLLVVGIYGLMSGMNLLLGMGQPVNARIVLYEATGGQATGMEGLSDLAFVLVTGLQSVVLAPFLALLIAFGEEYGWRGYLQSELIKLGKVRGVLLVGLIWGLWHTPVTLMGHNYPGYPVLGIPLMTLYCIALAFLFGFAVLKSGSIWVAAFLHALNNQVLSFLNLMVVRVEDPVLSFGTGIFGLAVWALVTVAILVLGRRVWSSPADPELQDGPGDASPLISEA